MNVEVDITLSRVSVLTLDQPADHRDHLRHVAGGPGFDLRRRAAQGLVRVGERPQVPLCHLPPRHALPLGDLEDLVVDVGDITAERHVVAAGPQPAHQDVENDRGPEVADMRRRLDRGAAEIDGHPAGDERAELANRPGGGVVQAQVHLHRLRDGHGGLRSATSAGLAFATHG